MKCPSSPAPSLYQQHNSVPSELYLDVNGKWCSCMVLIFWGGGGLRRTNGAALCLLGTASNRGEVDRNVTLNCVIVWVYFTQQGFTAAVFKCLEFSLCHSNTNSLSFRKVLISLKGTTDRPCAALTQLVTAGLTCS